ncbi:Imm72 family immunity protein [Paraburkholderia azotifigens]|uniref:Imm72 family immunity protein n=1 Tax=Paraburkholderia azotifigens TaxID=2057004 RepID=UPI003170B3C5
MNRYDMRDDLTRRRVFWLLQRLTSWSLWNAKREAFKVFANAYEAAIKTWPANDPEAPEADHLGAIHEILSCYNNGLAELSRGHRFVWRANQAFKVAARRFNGLDRYFYRNPKYWEHGSQFAPYPPKIDALYQLMHASQFQMDYAPLEVWTDDNIANLESPGSLLDPERYKHGFYALAYPTIPEVLPGVPVTPGPVIQSGQAVPCDGIWEPVTIKRSRILDVTSTEGMLFENDGCFNYLVAGTQAPNMSSVDDQALDITPRPTHWRLLWEDSRYHDGVIPNESEYLRGPSAGSDAPESTTIQPTRTGDPCPMSGEWFTTEYGGKTVHVAAGDPMPDLLATDSLGDRRVYWVTWQLVKR